MTELGSDERDLVRRWREGSDPALGSIVERHEIRLLALAALLVAEPAAAEGSLVEGFGAAARSLRRSDPDRKLEPWLQGFVVRAAAKVPAPRRRTAPAGAAPEPEPEDAAAATGDERSRAAIVAALPDLPFRQRAAVVLRRGFGLDYPDLAAAIGIPLEAAKESLVAGTRALLVATGLGLPAGTEVALRPDADGPRAGGAAAELPPSCAAARPLMDAHLLDALDQLRSALLATHLRTCAACSAELAGAARLGGLFRGIPSPVPSAGLHDRILAAIAAARTARGGDGDRRRGPLVAVIGSVALLAVVVVGLATGAFGGTATPSSSPTPTPLPSPSPSPSPTPTAAPTATPAPTPTRTPRPTPTPTRTPSPTPIPSKSIKP